MDKISYWKSFNLCKEVSLAGIFIYNGIKTFDEMDSFHNEEEIFDFFYNIAVGIERLEKIALILKEKIEIEKIQEFERSLKTHNHIELMNRIVEGKVVFNDTQTAFLCLLKNFYKNWRYDRYSVNDCKSCDKEKQALIVFLEKHYNLQINDEIFNTTQNSDRIKKSLGKCIGKIVIYLYEQIKEYSHQNNVFTYEVKYNSKAYKIFIRQEFDFILENKLWKEVLVYILNNQDNEYLNFYKSLPPLDFDEADLVTLINSFKNDINKIECIENLESLYDEMDNQTRKKRNDFLDLIGNESLELSDEIDYNND